MKRGFTLAELLGVTVLLALIVAVSYPVMINIFEEKQSELDSHKRELIENAAINYAKSNLNDYPYKEKQNSCIFLKTLIDNNLVGYDVEEDLYNRIVKVNYGINNKYTTEVLDAGITCTAYGLNEYKIETCEKKDSAVRYDLSDYRIEYYINDTLVKQTHNIKAENDSDLALFKVQANNYETLANSLKYYDGVIVTIDKSEDYFEMYVEFDMSNFTGFTDEQKAALVNAPIFYDVTTESLDTTCN